MIDLCIERTPDGSIKRKYKGQIGRSLFAEQLFGNNPIPTGEYCKKDRLLIGLPVNEK